MCVLIHFVYFIASFLVETKHNCWQPTSSNQLLGLGLLDYENAIRWDKEGKTRWKMSPSAHHNWFIFTQQTESRFSYISVITCYPSMCRIYSYLDIRKTCRRVEHVFLYAPKTNIFSFYYLVEWNNLHISSTYVRIWIFSS